MTTNTSSVLGCSPSVDWTFGPIVKSCRDDFDFTIAFEQYFFVICPAAILLIIAPLRVQHLSKLPRVVAGTFLESSKIVIMVVFAILQLVLVILWANQSTELGALRTICIAAASVSFTASVVSCFLSYVEHQKSIRPSFILNAYLLVSLTFDGAILRTFWLARLVLRIRGVFIASFTLKAGILILEAVEKRRFIIQKTDRGSPETTGSLYNQGFLWWMNRLLVIGYRSILKPVDLYNLDREMSSEVVGERFWHSWNGGKSESTHVHYSSQTLSLILKAGTSFTRSGRLVQICLKTLAWQLLSAVLARLFLLFFVLCQPLVLHQLLIFLENTTANSRKGYGLMAAYGLIYLGIAVSSVIYRHQTNRMLTMLRGMLMSAIFVQATKISVTGLDNAAAVTLMSTDVCSTSL
jgi:ATP-binding cassette subfamily C (CFTR/MRP) protein 1